MMSDHSTYRRNGVVVALVTGSLFIVSQQLCANGFALRESSASNLANAFAGSVSSARDASTGYYNPAGLSEFKCPELVVSGAYIKGHLKLYNLSGKNNAGGTVVGNQPTKPKSSGVVPGIHLAMPINNAWTFGFNVTTPFGLNTKYQGADFARYMATESKIYTLDISPSISYKVNHQWSVGFGLDALYVKATLAAAINVGLAADGFLINQAGHGWATGFHAGLMYKPSEDTKMGLTYHSRFTPRVRGSVVSNLFALGTPAPATVTGRVNMPDRISYGVTHKYDEKWLAMGELEWTHWSRFKDVRFNYYNPPHSQVVEQYYFKNTYRLSLGADYKYSKPLTLKGGFAFEQAPTNKTFVSPRLPDANRFWLAVGAKYAFNKNISVDGAYAHLFFKNITGHLNGVGDSRTLNANYKSSADIVGVQLTWNFV
jgi:long-chain fatty acid transport protein